MHSTLDWTVKIDNFLNSAISLLFIAVFVCTLQGSFSHDGHTVFGVYTRYHTNHVGCPH